MTVLPDHTRGLIQGDSMIVQLRVSGFEPEVTAICERLRQHLSVTRVSQAYPTTPDHVQVYVDATVPGPNPDDITEMVINAEEVRCSDYVWAVDDFARVIAIKTTTIYGSPWIRLTVDMPDAYVLCLPGQAVRVRREGPR